MNKNFNRAYYNRGIAKLGLKKYEDAILDFTKELEINQNNDAAYYNRGLAEQNLDHYVSAIDDFTKAIEINPNESDYYADRGALISKTNGDLKKAEQDLSKAIELDNSDKDKFMTRAVIFCKLKLYLAAIDDLNIVIRMDPNNTQAYDLRSFAINSLNNSIPKK